MTLDTPTALIWDRIAPGLRPPEMVQYGNPGKGHDGQCELTRYIGGAWRNGRIRIVVRRRTTCGPVAFVLAHELAHAMHWRSGVETTEEEADRVAHVVCRELQLCWLVARRPVADGVQEAWWVMWPGRPRFETYFLPENG